MGYREGLEVRVLVAKTRGLLPETGRDWDVSRTILFFLSIMINNFMLIQKYGRIIAMDCNHSEALKGMNLAVLKGVSLPRSSMCRPLHTHFHSCHFY